MKNPPKIYRGDTVRLVVEGVVTDSLGRFVNLTPGVDEFSTPVRLTLPQVLSAEVLKPTAKAGDTVESRQDLDDLPPESVIGNMFDVWRKHCRPGQHEWYMPGLTGATNPTLPATVLRVGAA